MNSRALSLEREKKLFVACPSHSILNFHVRCFFNYNKKEVFFVLPEKVILSPNTIKLKNTIQKQTRSGMGRIKFDKTN